MREEKSVKAVTDQRCGGDAADGPQEEGGVLQQVDEEVDRTVEHREQVRQVGHVLHPGRPDQLTLKAPKN